MRISAVLPAVLAALVVGLAGCSAPAGQAPESAAGTTASSNQAAFLAEHGWADMSAEQIVEAIDQDDTARPLDFKASVRPGELILGDAQGEYSLPLTSDDGFYLSIAPFVNRTHDCYFHSLATCKGELAGDTMHVTITDSAGTVLVDDEVTTYANGFVGFWLPRDITGTVEVDFDGRTGSVPFATADDSATCLTTLQLS